MEMRASWCWWHALCVLKYQVRGRPLTALLTLGVTHAWAVAGPCTDVGAAGACRGEDNAGAVDAACCLCLPDHPLPWQTQTAAQAELHVVGYSG